jgi:hypothetical protein
LKAKELQRKYGCPSWSLLPQVKEKKKVKDREKGMNLVGVVH